MKFNLTQDHIDRGLKENDRNCPVALCIMEKVLPLDKEINVCVGYSVIDLFSGPTLIYCFSTPKKVAEFIISFDEGKSVSPMGFALHLEKPNERGR